MESLRHGRPRGPATREAVREVLRTTDHPQMLFELGCAPSTHSTPRLSPASLIDTAIRL